MTSQLFRVIDGLHLIGGEMQFGRDHGADARHGDHQIKQFFQPSVGLNEFFDRLFDRFSFFFEGGERFLDVAFEGLLQGLTDERFLLGHRNGQQVTAGRPVPPG